MTESLRSDGPRFDEVCTRFEKAWLAGQRPRIEDYVAESPGPEKSALLRELIVLDVYHRLSHDESPRPEDYACRFPDMEATWVSRAVASGKNEYCQPTTEPALGPGNPGETPLEPGTVIPGYEIVALLGQGSMGTVYKALQLRAAKREVALKIIRADRLRNLPTDAEKQKWFARFQWEVEALVNLDHEHIVELYDVGEFEGQPYFSMKLVEGGTLASKSERFLSDPRAIAQLMVQVARALHHVHQRQILHRDLKPHNILIDSEGQPLVTDFGLALRIEPALTNTSSTDGIAGTLAFMAPEQAQSEPGRLTTAVDVYGLGAVLYYLLTEHSPHRGETLAVMLRNVREQEPQPPRTLKPHTDCDLEAVCLKCLRKDPAQRYSSAQHLAEDLERWLRGEPIRARPAGPVERLRKWVRRRPSLAAAWVCVLMALLTAGFFAYQDANNRAERLQVAIDHAIEVALSGNLDRSEGAIREAELKGASTGQVRLLRGLVAFQQSDTKSAIADLEQATELLPNSVAARALLATFHFRAGHWYLHDKQMEYLAAMQAKTPEDFLFKGYQLSFYDASEALPTLDEALRRRDTNIAYAMRAEARARYALDRTDLAMAERAQDDASAALVRLPDHPFSLSASLQTHLVAAILFTEPLQPPQRKSALNKAQLLVKQLEALPDYPWIGEHRAQYYEMLGDATNADKALEQAAVGLKNNPAIFAHAINLWRRKKDAREVLNVLNQRKDEDDLEGDRLAAFLSAKGPQFEVDKFFQQATRKNYHPEYALIVQLMRGEKKAAQDRAAAIRLTEWRVTPERKAYDEQFKAYASGADTSAEALLKAANWSRSCLCSAHFLIGMTHLADGERGKAEARKHLEKAVETYDYFNNDYILSRAILARIQ